MKVLLFIIMIQGGSGAKWENQGSFESMTACETAVRSMKQTAPHFRFEHVCAPR
jgi:hypothetical protein